METVRNKIYETKAADADEKGHVTIAVNAFGNEDSDGDVSLPGSFKKTLKEHFNRVRWFLDHDTTKLLGVPIKGYETAEHLVMEAQFNMQVQLARDVYEFYKLFAAHGRSLEHSVGLQAIKYQIDQTSQIRTISEWKLWEFSTLQSWGANENTPLLGIKTLLNEINQGRFSDPLKRTTESLMTGEPSKVTPKVSTADRKYMTELYNLLKI